MDDALAAVGDRQGVAGIGIRRAHRSNVVFRVDRTV